MPSGTQHGKQDHDEGHHTIDSSEKKILYQYARCERRYDGENVDPQQLCVVLFASCAHKPAQPNSYGVLSRLLRFEHEIIKIVAKSQKIGVTRPVRTANKIYT
jgi:hypothetical protein